MLSTIRLSPRTFIRIQWRFSSVLDAYKERVLDGTLRYNEAQMTVAKVMHKIDANLTGYESSLGFKYLLSLQQVHHYAPTPRGMYLWGPVGIFVLLLLLPLNIDLPL